MTTTPVTERQAAVEPVPFYDGSHSFEEYWPDLKVRIEQVMDRGKYSHGTKVSELEHAVELYTGARHAVGVGNGTDALILLLRAAGIGPGDEVIVPCFTFVASATSVVHARATPVFVDVDPVTYMIDVESARAAITERTKAIMPVHLFTQMADMTALLELSQETGIRIVEDSAEAIGMWYDGVHAGLLGAGGVLSFFPTKTLAALGDAGMILTNDPALADQCSVLRHHGRLGTTVDHMAGISNVSGVSGTNSKMDDIQAAVLLTRLERLNREIAKRAALARFYDEQLAHLADVVRTPAIVRRHAATNPVYYVYVVDVERKDELVAHLTAHGIGTEEYYPRPLHLQPCFTHLGYRPGRFPNAERACGRTVALPFYPDLTLDAAERVCRVIAEFHGR